MNQFPRFGVIHHNRGTIGQTDRVPHEPQESDIRFQPEQSLTSGGTG